MINLVIDKINFYKKDIYTPHLQHISQTKNLTTFLSSIRKKYLIRVAKHKTML